MKTSPTEKYQNKEGKISFSAQLILYKWAVVNSPLLQNGFCFVEFDDYRDAHYEMNSRDLLGDRVTVEIARAIPHGRDREKWCSCSGGNSKYLRPKMFSIKKIIFIVL